MSKDLYQDKLQQSFLMILVLPQQIEVCLQKLQNELCARSSQKKCRHVWYSNGKFFTTWRFQTLQYKSCLFETMWKSVELNYISFPIQYFNWNSCSIYLYASQHWNVLICPSFNCLQETPCNLKTHDQNMQSKHFFLSLYSVIEKKMHWSIV